MAIQIESYSDRKTSG